MSCAFCGAREQLSLGQRVMFGFRNKRHERDLESGTWGSAANEASFSRLCVECQSVIPSSKRLWTNQMCPRAALGMGLARSRHASAVI